MKPDRLLVAAIVAVSTVACTGLPPTGGPGDDAPAITWTNAAASDAGIDLQGIAFGRSRFVAVGKFGTIRWSEDGFRWSSPSEKVTTSHLLAVAHGGPQFVAVGLGGEIVTSEDGSSWTRRESGTGWALSGVCYNGRRFIAVGQNGTILTSPKGVVWSALPSTTSRMLYSVACSPDAVVAVGTGGTVYRSTDGLTWVKLQSDISADLLTVAHTGVGFVAAGPRRLYTSALGAKWAPLSTGWSGLDGLSVLALVHGGTTVVAVTAQGDFLGSPNGSTWDTLGQREPVGLTGVAYGNSRFVAVGFEGAAFVGR